MSALALSTVPAHAGVDEARKAELRYLLEQDCGSCHGMTRKGGLGSPLVPEQLAERSDADLVAIILDGVPDTPMPPWRALISEPEAEYLVELLRDNGDGNR